jgi:hypothetical protein
MRVALRMSHAPDEMRSSQSQSGETEKRRRPRGRLRDDRDGERSAIQIDCIRGNNLSRLNFKTSAVSFAKNVKITEATHNRRIANRGHAVDGIGVTEVQYLRLSRSKEEGCGYRCGG